MKVSNWILNIMSSADAGSSQDNGPIHRAHAVADLNQSETRNAAIFSMDFLAHTLVSQTMAQHTLTQCSFVVFGSIAQTQQNGESSQILSVVSTEKNWDLFFLFPLLPLSIFMHVKSHQL